MLLGGKWSAISSTSSVGNVSRAPGLGSICDSWMRDESFEEVLVMLDCTPRSPFDESTEYSFSDEVTRESDPSALLCWGAHSWPPIALADRTAHSFSDDVTREGDPSALMSRGASSLPRITFTDGTAHSSLVDVTGEGDSSTLLCRGASSLPPTTFVDKIAHSSFDGGTRERDLSKLLSRRASFLAFRIFFLREDTFWPIFLEGRSPWAMMMMNSGRECRSFNKFIKVLVQARQFGSYQAVLPLKA